MTIKDDVINIRVSREFKQKIVNAIRNRADYTITRVLTEGAELVIKKLTKENDKGN